MKYNIDKLRIPYRTYLLHGNYNNGCTMMTMIMIINRVSEVESVQAEKNRGLLAEGDKNSMDDF